MKITKTQKITYFMGISIVLLIFADISIFAGLQVKNDVNSFKASSFYELLTYRRRVEVISRVNTDNDQDRIMPIVELPSDEFTITSENVQVIAYSSELLEEVESENFSMSLNTEFNDNEYYAYDLQFMGLEQEDNEKWIRFSDLDGNTVSKNVNIEVEAGLVLGAYTIRDEKILPVSDDDILVLVDKQYAIPSDYEADDLVNLSDYDIPSFNNDVVVRNVVIHDLEKLIVDAKEEGFNLVIRSGYRSYLHQTNLYNFWYLEQGMDYVGETVAFPGHSEHQLGTAVDFSNEDVKIGKIWNFKTTEDAKWLEENAYKYGFVLSYPKGMEEETGYKYEIWHYRYVGVEMANEIFELNLPLNVYLKNSYFSE